MQKDTTNTNIESFQQENRKYPPSNFFKVHANIQKIETYEEMYNESITNPDKFWLEQAETLDWLKKPSIACEYEWNSEKNIIEHSWFKDGTINLSYNCLDRHNKGHFKLKPAIIWQGDDPKETVTLDYQTLHNLVCKLANVLKKLGVKKGDRLCIYLPSIPECAVAMLASARIGAIHSVVFAGYSADSLADRINDSSCKIVITANAFKRGNKLIHLKNIVDEALLKTETVEHVIVIKRNDEPFNMTEKRDVSYEKEMEDASHFCPIEPMNAEDPLFIIYTSGSTGRPKGVVHTQAGYLLHTTLTHKYFFDYKDSDVYWCTADVGWITGHSYVIYAPLANGATTVMFEGIPLYPDAGRYWEIVEKFGVTVFYTAPTAIRALISFGEEYPEKYDLSSLRLLGSVGEPINPEAWIWYYKNIGKEKCPIVDTWWQTESGGVMIAPLPGCHEAKPGSASKPFFGVEPVIICSTEAPQTNSGALCIKKPWPGIMRTTWGDHQRFIDTYFKTFDNVYFSGDGCFKDADGDYWLLGRIDDVINVSGHRIGTAEVESALVSHKSVAESAIVPIPHDIKGQALFAFIILKQNFEGSDQLKNELITHVRKVIGAIAVPEKIRFAKGLPKTRSGKIMRRILRKIAENNLNELGDISTLADPNVIQDLLKGDF